MTSSKNNRNRKGQSRRGGALDVLTGVFHGRGALRTGFVSTLALLCSVGFATGSYAQTATTPWIGQNGREIVDLNAKPIVSTTNSKVSAKSAKVSTKKKSSAKRDNHIRQIRADVLQEEPWATPGEVLGVPQTPDADLPFEVEPPVDPTTIENPPISLRADSTVPSAPSTIPQAPLNTAIQATDSVPSYGGGEVARESRASQNVDSGVSRRSAPSYSTNPYARIGQAEYNPSLFYGTASPNASINGYRNAPPAVAYGQPGVGCGSQCPDGSCGVFGGFFQNTQVSAGFDNMRSPLDLSDTGNTGADVAVNWGSPRPVFGGLHAQAGVRGVFSDLNGNVANGFYTPDCRSQLFWTAGLYFRASQYSADGLSMGIAYDSLKESYYRKYELNQLRAEVSYTLGGLTTFGFRGAFGLSTEWFELFQVPGQPVVEAKAEVTDYYVGFLRRNFEQGGEATVFGGGTKSSGGIVGGSIEAPLTDSFSLKCSGAYVFAKERGGLTKREEETWNMSMGLVWRLGGGARGMSTSPQPLFDVADNGTFLQNFVR